MKRRNETTTQAVDGDTTEIAALAYQLWQARGCPEGSPEADWLRAEELLRENAKPAELMAAA